jgi:hypothetical protein
MRRNLPQAIVMYSERNRNHRLAPRRYQMMTQINNSWLSNNMPSTSNTNRESYPKRLVLVRRKLCRSSINARMKRTTSVEEDNKEKLQSNLPVSQP